MRAVHRINGCTVFRSHSEITAAGRFLRRIVISGVRMRYSSGACCVKVVSEELRNDTKTQNKVACGAKGASGSPEKMSEVR